jgi:sigma-B regulation protein RsbU (phosphoserine phosphatase)
LLSNIPKLNRQYKAIVVSAYGDMSNIRSAMNKGASDFVIKPIDFNDFEVTLRKMIDEYNKMKDASRAQALLQDLQKELDIARVIQEAMLPNSGTPFAGQGIEISGKMIPAKEVGGDFYDYFALDGENLALFIADVSGKSISACLYMVVTKSILRALSRRKLKPIEVITQMNELLSADNRSNMFVTGFYAVLNVKSGELTYCNAGHNPP